MPLQLPNLDDQTYADLMEEARRLIPTYAPEWTNHNPSDPGITVTELFAYLSEILLYRLNLVTKANQRKFLKLLNGPDWAPSGELDDLDSLEADKRATVQGIRALYRAVTAEDFERLTVEVFNPLLGAMKRAEEAGASIDEWWSQTGLDRNTSANRPSELVAVSRVRCVPVRNLERGTEKERTQPEPGHVSLVIVPEAADPWDAHKPLREAVWGFLDGRRMLTTRHHVVGPSYAPISADLVIARTNDAVENSLRERVLQKLEEFLHPLKGGVEQQGWPFGRDVYVSELCEQLEAIPGVDYVTDVMLSSECQGGEERCVQASPLWHAEGDLVGLGLAQHHLPRARITPARIVIAPHPKFVPVRLTVSVESAVADPASVKQRIKSAIRTFFHPLLDGPGPAAAADTDLLGHDLEDALEPIAGTVSLRFEVDATRSLQENGETVGFHVKAGEVVNWSAVVKLPNS